MICPRCGARLPSDSRFCNNCGYRVPKQAKFKIEKNYDNDIYSSSARSETISSRSTTPKRKKKKKSVKRKIAIVLLSILCVALAVIIAFISWGYTSLDNIDRTELTSDLGIDENNVKADEDVKNILLYGIDSRKDNLVGRSDAIILVSIDKKNDKIKMTSIARDSYVTIAGHGKDKLTHAWAYGKADLAVKTVNENFGTDVTDFVAVNFFKFAEIIDYVGGVMIHVDESEKNFMNSSCIPNINALGIKCDMITETGMQHLSGGQALAYVRNRTTGGDIERGNRQKEVLEALMEKMKSTSFTKYPEIISTITKSCTTSLTKNDILSLGTWAALNKPTIEKHSLPNKACNSTGKLIKGVWYYVYDLEIAKQQITDFVYNDIKPEDK